MEKTLRHNSTAILGMWWGWNYGALLTSFALYKVLQNMGHYPVLVDHSPMSETWEHCNDANTPFRKFLSDLEVSTVKVSDFSSSCRLNTHFSTFVVGSDQLWRHQYTHEFGTQFFLDFADIGKRKISYSTSLGDVGTEIPNHFRQVATELLSHFDAISVREFSGVEELNRLFEADAVQVLDPVFLLQREEWLKISEKGKAPESTPYLLSYILDNRDETRTIINKLLPKYPHHYIIPDFEKPLTADQYATSGILLKKIDIVTWLSAIAHSDFFITDSFHGACFAIILNKPFVCIMNSRRGKTRFETLQRLFPNLAHCFVENASSVIFTDCKTADFSIANAIIQKNVIRSKDWLTSAFNLPPKTHSAPTQIIRPYRKPSKLKICLSKIKSLIQRLISSR